MVINSLSLKLSLFLNLISVYTYENFLILYYDLICKFLILYCLNVMSCIGICHTYYTAWSVYFLQKYYAYVNVNTAITSTCM